MTPDPRSPHRTQRSPWAILVVIAIGVQALIGAAVLASPQAPEVTVAPLLADPEEAAVAPVVMSAPEVPDATYLADLSRPEPEPEPPPAGSSAAIFASEFPEHAAARQRPGDPATHHWAVIVGVNDYAPPTGSTFGSVADAEVLRGVLLDRGWREDHVLLLTEDLANHDRVVRALEWLARSTDDDSTVVFSSSGHMRHREGRTAIWPSDNQLIWVEDFGRLVGAVQAERMWISLQGCHAAGLRSPGVEAPGRVVTYSSHVAEKSFEDPETGHSLQGFYVFAEGIRDGWGDADGDGRVSIQEAHGWGGPRAAIRSAGQQNPVMVDGLGRPFHLEVGH